MKNEIMLNYVFVIIIQMKVIFKLIFHKLKYLMLRKHLLLVGLI